MPRFRREGKEAGARFFSGAPGPAGRILIAGPCASQLTSVIQPGGQQGRDFFRRSERANQRHAPETARNDDAQTHRAVVYRIDPES
jgi:hypothetical protein